MKKFIFIFAFLFLLLFPCSKGITVYAETLSDTSEHNTDEENNTVSYGPPSDAKIELDENDKKGILGIIQTLQESTNLTWDAIANQIKNFTTLPVGDDSSPQTTIDIMEQAHKFEVIFKPMAYSICLLFIGLNILNTAIKYEIMTFKGGASIVVRTLFAKVWVDLSYKICEWIILFNDSIVVALINHTQNIRLTLPSPDVEPSKVWVIGPIIDIFNLGVAAIPLILIALIMLVAGAIISIKLMIRVLEITLMVIVSPPFFACLAGGESTQRYFRNFIVTFVSVVVETIFMAIVLGLGSNWWGNVSSSTYDNYIINFLPNLGLIIVICVMMVKPPKILKNLIA